MAVTDTRMPNIWDISLANVRSFLQGKRSHRAAWGFWFFGNIAYGLLILPIAVPVMALAGQEAGVEFFFENRVAFQWPFYFVTILAIWRCSKGERRLWWKWLSRGLASALLVDVVLAPFSWD